MDGEQEELPEGALGLEFEGVSFSYNEDKPVLKDINFEVKPGERLGIIGRTGAESQVSAVFCFDCITSTAA